MIYKHVAHVTVQMGKLDELTRVLRDELVPVLARDPDFVVCRLYRRVFGPDLGCQIEFEYRSAAGATKLLSDLETRAWYGGQVAALLSSSHAELMMEVGDPLTGAPAGGDVSA